MIRLRGLIADDLGYMFEWRNDPRINHWTRQNDVISSASHKAWFERQAHDPKIKMYAIDSGCVGKHWQAPILGVCGLTDIDLINRRAEFSLYIGPEYHGNGYGEAALRLLLEKGFKTYGLNSIWGETFDGNPAAKMVEKIGFKKEGTRRAFYFRDGKFIDAHLYSILNSEFQS